MRTREELQEMVTRLKTTPAPGITIENRGGVFRCRGWMTEVPGITSREEAIFASWVLWSGEVLGMLGYDTLDGEKNGLKITREGENTPLAEIDGSGDLWIFGEDRNGVYIKGNGDAELEAAFLVHAAKVALIRM